jgi:hypothetical protein
MHSDQVAPKLLGEAAGSRQQEKGQQQARAEAEAEDAQDKGHGTSA